MQYREEGMTLVELLVALALSAVLLGVAVPAMSRMMDRAVHETLVHELLIDLALCRAESIRSGKLVVMCASSGEGRCDAEANWARGRLLFVDSNSNGWREMQEPVLGIRERAPSGWVVAGNQPVGRYVAYQPSGRTVQIGGALQMGTLTICGRDLEPLSHQIVINATGRPRLQKASASACGG